MKKVLLITILTVLPVFVNSVTFERNLTLGVQGNDVLELQKTLNKDPLTRIAQSGPGSPGNETTYFGQMTRNAVIKFQELYAPEVLFPAGLYRGTGFVGSYTLKKLNLLSQVGDSLTQNTVGSVVSSIPTGAVSQTTIQNIGATVFADIPSNLAPKIFSLSRYEATRGTEILISGENFDFSDNTISFSGSANTINNVLSEDGKTMSFVVPEWISYGTYNLSVNNKNGTSFDKSFGNYFSVSEKTKDLPKIFSIEPKSMGIYENHTVTIGGENFDKENNTIISFLGTVEGINSVDGRTIKVNLKDFSSFSQLQDTAQYIETGGYSFDVFFYVKTDVGISAEQIPLSVIF